jgi:hypothetical protein
MTVVPDMRIIKTITGKEEIVLSSERMVLTIQDMKAKNIMFWPFIFLYAVIFCLFVIRSGLFIVILYLLAGLIVYAGFYRWKYLYDFNKRKIFFMFIGLIKIPVMKFSEIGGIDKVWVEELDFKKHFFYRIWKKKKRFGFGVPLSGLHGCTEKFDDDFAKFILPVLFDKFQIQNLYAKYQLIKTDNPKGVPGNAKKYSFSCHFDEINEKIYFRRGIKRVVTIFGGIFIIMIASLSIIFITRGIFLLFLIILFYFMAKYASKNRFYIFLKEGNVNFYFIDENLSVSVDEIKRVIIRTKLHVSFRFVVAISFFIETVNSKIYFLGDFSSLELTDAEYFINKLQSIAGKGLLMRVEFSRFF